MTNIATAGALAVSTGDPGSTTRHSLVALLLAHDVLERADIKDIALAGRHPRRVTLDAPALVVRPRQQDVAGGLECEQVAVLLTLGVSKDTGSRQDGLEGRFLVFE
ncbi:hypothetical protein RRG08_044413 [Elysia crispata]|uniref:Uncharacterized protein n=1 Tax=Elysia crispata TaxID=231223 RepID=A0AAE0ZUZ2_9GAST|nr:hypothetical protein RRG08_044413 [Elysia crispata]